MAEFDKFAIGRLKWLEVSRKSKRDSEEE